MAWCALMWHALCARFCQLAWSRIADGIFQKMLNSPRHGTLREGAPFPPPSLCLSLYFRGKLLINAVAHTHRGATNNAGHKLRAQIPFRFSHLFVLWQPKDNSNSNSSPDNCDNFARLHQKFIAKFQFKFAAFFKKTPKKKETVPPPTLSLTDCQQRWQKKMKWGRVKATVEYPVWKEQMENSIK